MTKYEALLDKEGFLKNLDEWTEEITQYLADQEGIILTDAHWELILLLRAFFQEYQISPAMRPLVKAVGKKLGADKGKSIYLLQLFPGSPAKLMAKLAGLPKPANCL